MWDFFDMKVCLNHPAAIKRWGDSVTEFNRVGLSGIARFAALTHIGPHQSFNASVNAILQSFLRSSCDSLLLLEDDVVFTDLEPLKKALNELPPDWDILYLGANLAVPRFDAPKPYSPHLQQINNAWTTHAVAYRKKITKFIIENQPGYSEQMFDNWLSAQLHDFNAFVVDPLVAYQRPGKSLIWNSHTNYNSVFAHTNIILKRSRT